MSGERSRIHDVPGYEVTLEPHAGTARASLGGEIIAESTRSMRLRETRHAAVLYFPRDDVRWEHLEATDHTTFCPFKGHASYWTVRTPGQVEENAVWGYANPFSEIAELSNYVAFYADRIRVEDAVPLSEDSGNPHAP